MEIEKMKSNDAWKEAGVMQPLTCSIDLTEACNLACTYCFTHSKHKKRVITWDMATRIIDWWLPQTTGQNGATQITAWGGEPLLEWELWKRIVEYTNNSAKKLDINMEYGGTTNGILYTPDKIEWCANNKSLFMVSIDGIQPAHDMFRKMPSGKGSWKIIDKNLREGIKVYPKLRVRMSTIPETAHWFFESIQYFVEDIGIKHIAFSPVIEHEWSEEALKTLREQYDLSIDYAIKKAKEGDPIILKHINDAARRNGMKLDPQNPCGAGRQYMGWSVDGFLFPCHRFNKHGLTTKQRAKLPTIIGRPKGKSFEYCNIEWRNSFEEFKSNPPDHCDGCELYRTSTCNGNCYAVNYDLTGDIKGKVDAACKVKEVEQKAGLRYAKLAKEEGVEIIPAGWGDAADSINRSCVCYNMCYSEGTSFEITNINRQDGKGCLCYNASYGGDPKPQARTIKELDAEKETIKNALRIALQMIENKNKEKTTEQIEAEKNFLEAVRKII
jgi:uncharacterized protein